MNNRIKSVRKHFNMTQTDFAEALSLSRNFISLIENGEREPSARTIKDICSKYNVNETWLLTGAGEMLAPVTKEQEIGQLVADILKNDPEEIREEFKEVILGMSDAQLVVLHDFIMETAEKFKSLPKK